MAPIWTVRVMVTPPLPSLLLACSEPQRLFRVLDFVRRRELERDELWGQCGAAVDDQRDDGRLTSVGVGRADRLVVVGVDAVLGADVALHRDSRCTRMGGIDATASSAARTASSSPSACPRPLRSILERGPPEKTRR